jgi:snRNA-activating protein complex subunit 3
MYGLFFFCSLLLFISFLVTSDVVTSRKRKIDSTFIWIPEWMATTPLPSSSLVLDMDNIRFDDITWDFNKPYLFCHHGCCEHIIKVLDIHQIHPSLDSGRSGEYPREVYRSRHRQRRCQVCDVLSANFIVFCDRLSEFNPCFYCQ